MIQIIFIVLSIATHDDPIPTITFIIIARFVVNNATIVKIEFFLNTKYIPDSSLDSSFDSMFTLLSFPRSMLLLGDKLKFDGRGTSDIVGALICPAGVGDKWDDRGDGDGDTEIDEIFSKFITFLAIKMMNNRRDNAIQIDVRNEISNNKALNVSQSG